MQNPPDKNKKSTDERITDGCLEGAIGIPAGLPPAKPHDKYYMIGWAIAESMEFEFKLKKLQL